MMKLEKKNKLLFEKPLKALKASNGKILYCTCVSVDIDFLFFFWQWVFMNLHF